MIPKMNFNKDSFDTCYNNNNLKLTNQSNMTYNKIIDILRNKIKEISNNNTTFY